MTDCVCGHDEQDHDSVGCMGPPNGRYCTCLDYTLPPTPANGPETAAKAAALIPERIY